MVAETSLFRVPQLLEKMMPFCVLIGAMTCYLALSRRLELVVARAAGVSAWQFIAPALGERDPARRARHRRLQSDVGEPARALQAHGSRAVRRRARRRRAGRLGLLDQPDQCRRPGHHQRRAQRAAGRAADRADAVPVRHEQPCSRSESRRARRRSRTAIGCSRACAAIRSMRRRSIRTASSFRRSLTPAQVRNSFSTPETVSFWQLPGYIRSSESSGFATAGYRLQYHKLLAQPFLLAAMVMLAASVSLALLPIRRRAKDGFEWRGRRLSALRSVESN